MVVNLPFALFLITTVLQYGSFSLAENEDDAIRKLLGNLERFKPQINGSLEKVVETMRKNRQAARQATLLASMSQVASLQAKIDKVGKLLNIVADLIWDRIYFATSGGKIMVHSLETGDTKVVVENPENPETREVDGFYGVTYDPKEKKMYFSSKNAIYRANIDGSDIEMALSTMKYDVISGLSFDWIAGNLYGVSWAGIVFVCKARVKGLMTCFTVLKGQGRLNGIGVDPINGTMYYAGTGKIKKSYMDGSEHQVFLEGLGEPVGVMIDYQNNSLISTDSANNQTWYTKLDGGDPDSIISIQSMPRGIALLSKRMCVGTGSSLTCSKKSSLSVFDSVYSANKQINHLFTPGFKYVYDRPNDCEAGPACKTVCILNSKSSSMCLDVQQ